MFREDPIKLYKKRWLILSLFFVYSAIGMMQWLQYAVIADVMVDHYKTSYSALEWSAMIYLLAYVSFGIPGNYIVFRSGLRFAILTSIIGTSVGTWIKLASVFLDKYWVYLVGQGVTGIFQVFIIPIPPKLAAMWFGEKEVPIVTGAGVFSLLIGVAIGYIIPPLIVSSGSHQQVKSYLCNLSYIYAGLPTMLIPILYFFFENAPPLPPSIPQLQLRHSMLKNESFVKTAKDVLKNRSFLILVVVYGIYLGTSYAICMLLNEILLNHYPGQSYYVGQLGFAITLAGTVGCILGGYVLSKFNRYRATTFITFFVCLLATTGFLFLLDKGLPIVYGLGMLAGALFYAILTVGFEVGVELTFPAPEGVSSGFLTLSVQIFGILITLLYTYMLKSVKEFWANVGLCGILLVAWVLLFFVRFEMKRQKTNLMTINSIQ